MHTLYFQSSTGCPAASPQRDGAVEDVGMTCSCHVRENRVSGTSVVRPEADTSVWTLGCLGPMKRDRKGMLYAYCGFDQSRCVAA